QETLTDGSRRITTLTPPATFHPTLPTPTYQSHSPLASGPVPAAAVVPAAPVVPLSGSLLPTSAPKAGVVGRDMLQQSWNQVWNEKYLPMTGPARIEIAPMPRVQEAIFTFGSSLFGGH